MIYLLDTDTYSYITKEVHPSVSARFRSLQGNEWAISAITLAEIHAGLESTPSAHRSRSATAKLLFTTTVLDWPSTAAPIYATLKHALRQQPLAPLDLLIASHAIAIDATLVSNNTRHFERIGAPLRLENWVNLSKP